MLHRKKSAFLSCPGWSIWLETDTAPVICRASPRRKIHLSQFGTAGRLTKKARRLLAQGTLDMLGRCLILNWFDSALRGKIGGFGELFSSFVLSLSSPASWVLDVDDFTVLSQHTHLFDFPCFWAFDR